MTFIPALYEPDEYDFIQFKLYKLFLDEPQGRWIIIPVRVSASNPLIIWVTLQRIRRRGIGELVIPLVFDGVYINMHPILNIYLSIQLCVLSRRYLRTKS